jgi:hypothetical protein
MRSTSATGLTFNLLSLRHTIFLIPSLLAACSSFPDNPSASTRSAQASSDPARHSPEDAEIDPLPQELENEQISEPGLWDREGTIAAANARLSHGQICDDYELALHLLALVQTPAGRRGDTTDSATLAKDLARCPATYFDMARDIAKRQQALHDLHTSFSPVDNLAVALSPTVTACDDASVCGATVGASLGYMPTEVSDALYAYALTPNGVLTFAVDSVNGESMKDAVERLRNEELLIHRDAGGASSLLSRQLFTRTFVDGQDRSDLRVVARSLEDGRRFAITASFAVAPTVVSTHHFKPTGESGPYRSRGYDCATTAPNSTPDVGACTTTDGRLVVWVRSWFDGDPTDRVGSFVAAQGATQKLPILMDVRGNTGGDPGAVARFVCTFGDDTAVKVMNTRRLAGTIVPATFALSSGTVIKTRSLGPRENSALLRIDPDWHVSSSAPDAHRRDFTQPFLERFKLTGSSCLAMRAPSVVGKKWLVLTNGSEFSATENFLSFIEDSRDTFHIVGDVTRGGTGAPTVFTLPNTFARLRLSLARHIDGRDDDSFKIEGVGVKPFQPLLRDFASDFEARAVEFQGNPAMNFDQQRLAPYIVRYALGMRP